MTTNNPQTTTTTNPTTSTLLRSGPFRVILDCRARPRYIMVADSSLRVAQIPHSTAPYFSSWIQALTNVLMALSSETTISIHMGFYRTQKHFHLHFVASDPDQYRQHWINVHGTQKVKELDSWDVRNATKTRKYQRQDIADLRRRLPRRANQAILETLGAGNVCFHEDSPILSLPTLGDLGDMVSALHTLSQTLGLQRRHKGGHMCLRPVGPGYMGWLFLDLPTYYSIHPDPARWLLAFEANNEFEIWT